MLSTPLLDRWAGNPGEPAQPEPTSPDEPPAPKPVAPDKPKAPGPEQPDSPGLPDVPDGRDEDRTTSRIR